MRKPDPEFWNGRRVLVTGHTGFKGTWLVLWLRSMGADVTGYSLPPATKPSMFELVKLKDDCVSVLGDVRDAEAIKVAVNTAHPDVVFHMAAQAIVKIGLEDPELTFSTNVMGTVNLLDALLQPDVPLPSACIVVTSDKVYSRSGDKDCFKEGDPLGGDEPYSSSKAAQEMVVSAYRNRFEKEGRNRLVSARAGNVVGGGDFSPFRLVPDIWRASQECKTLVLRMPDATRPWQHVLDCLFGYLLYAEAVSRNADVPTSLNFGPKEHGIRVSQVAEIMRDKLGKDIQIVKELRGSDGEYMILNINSSLAQNVLNWASRINGNTIFNMTATWYSRLDEQINMIEASCRDIETYTAC